VSRRFARYVAIGDSSTEGLDDPDGAGGYRGWANRLAEKIAAAQGSLLYANLAVRGLTTRKILETQLEPALAMQPDLVTLFSGTNDVVRRRFDAAAVARDVTTMQRACIARSATVLGFTLPDLSAVMPLARPIAWRVHALNDALRRASEDTGAVLVDFAKYPVGSDPRLWSADRLHANAAGHERIACALAWALELPGTNMDWSKPLEATSPRTFGQKVVAEIAWGRKYFLPWVWRHLNGRSSGDGITAKRPTLTPVSSDGRPRRAAPTAIDD
jgi:lysophospholipase L1-like esterase